MVEVDTWSDGNNENQAPAPGADQGADTLYHVSVNFNASLIGAQSNVDTGVTLPNIFSQAAGFPANGLTLEINYAPIDASTSKITVWGSSTDGNFPRTKIIDVFGPRLNGDVTLGYSAATGGATENWDVVGISVAPVCAELTDSVAIEGTLEGEVDGDPVALTAVGGGLDGDATYTWTATGPGTIAPNGASAAVTCTDAGVVNVTVEVADGGCGDDASASVDVTCVRVGVRLVPGDVNGDGNVDISDPSALLINLFQNPNHELVCGADPNSPANLAIIRWFEDEATVNLSAVVASLDWQFRGGPAHYLNAAAEGPGCATIEGCEHAATCQ
jgi:hypothetical protein